MTTLFRLGHQPHISHAEVAAVLEAKGVPFSVIQKNGEYLVISTEQPLDYSLLMGQLGSIVWIAEEVAEDTDHISLVADYLQDHQPDGKIQFSLRAPQAKTLALEVKKALKGWKRSVRYVEAKNTATIIHNNLVEKGSDLTVFGNRLFVTRAVQPIEEFSERDYGKPGIDSRSGMLPPKLARIMINLSGVSTRSTLLDPFCGSGVVLMEALTLGFSHVVGTDVSKKAIEDATKNIAWLEKKNPQVKDKKKKIFLADAKNLSRELPHGSVDVIIAEPYMGKPLRGRESQVDLERQALDLGILYADSFREFGKILKKHGVVIFIIPKFKYKDRWISIKCVEQIEKHGFTAEAFPSGEKSLLYWRDKQFVGREIWKFVKR